MGKTENIELTVLCLIYKGDQILLQNRVKQDWKGYCLPGGHVEKDESIVDAVIREMKEETGLTIYHPVLCGVKQFPTDDGRYLVLLFQTDKFDGKLCASSEGEMHWVRRTELSQLDTVDDLEALLQVMESRNLNEFQYVVENGNWRVRLK